MQLHEEERDARSVPAQFATTPGCHGAATAFGAAVPIAILGGLTGVGGAGFRLPFLMGPLGYGARRAVPLNLAVGLVTIAASLAARSRSLSLDPVAPYAPVLLALTAGAVVAALAGTGLFHRLSDRAVERTVLIGLFVIGCALIVEGFLPTATAAPLPVAIWLPAGVLFGLVIGLVSSFGVAGGEVIIPTLIFAYGIDVKTAGTASLLVSVPGVLAGIARYARRGAYDRAAVVATVVPMGAGSIVGAVIGGMLVGVVAASVLKLVLGVVIIVSTVRMARQP
ncbi:MAG: sulfite exporter TauE/SafE family protein [Chloroflexia bacterium]|nr:sulfite exporter TauE/SafE family protein [Chloroflexia bacterium]